MNVELIASTALTVEGYTGKHNFAIDPVTERYMETDPDASDADTLAEFAGRACYESFHKPNEKTRANVEYIANILRQNHGSVLEHSSATFFITGVSRSLSHEIIRHRAGTAFSELSQRFVDMAEVQYVMPPAMRELRPAAMSPEEQNEDFQRRCHETFTWEYENLAEELHQEGYPRKQVREAARAVLPNATETRIVMTANMRAWRHIVKVRGSEHADAEIRELALELLRLLRGVAPAMFQDYSTEVLEDGREVVVVSQL